MQLSFNNTEIAFRHKSTADLHKAKRLFKLFAYPFIVEKGPIIANFCLSLGLPIKGLIKRTIFHQFCGGEDIERSHSTALTLAERGIGAILDFSVEGEGDEASYLQTYQEILRTIDFIADEQVYPFAVFKPSGIASIEVLRKVQEGEELGPDEARSYAGIKERIEGLCQRAYDKGVRIFIDAEESWMQDPIDSLTYAMMERFNKAETIVFNTIQLYRTNRIPAMEEAIANAKERGYKMGFKLVRGAYLEKERERALKKGYPSPVHDTKEATDKDYDDAIRLCIRERDWVSVCAGTHNEVSSLLMAEEMDRLGIARNDERFWFAQLFGMSDHISYNLAEAGFNVAKYLPYGPVRKVLPYLSRRAEENSAVKGQAGRELIFIDRELERRKAEKAG